MHTWTWMKAVASPEALIDAAVQHGPQVITHDDRRLAVMLAYNRYVELNRASGLVEHIREAEVMGLALVPVRARRVRFERGRVVVELSDGREIAVPLDWFSFLCQASLPAREYWEIDAEGSAIFWPELAAGFEGLDLLTVEEQTPPHPGPSASSR